MAAGSPRLGRYAEPAAGILRLLRAGPRPASEISAELRIRNRPVRPGTLCAALARLERLGLIEPIETPSGSPPYRLSERALDTAGDRIIMS